MKRQYVARNNYKPLNDSRSSLNDYTAPTASDSLLHRLYISQGSGVTHLYGVMENMTWVYLQIS